MPHRIPRHPPSLEIKAVNGKGWQSSWKKRTVEIEDTSEESWNSTRRAQQPTTKIIDITPINQQDMTPSIFNSEKLVIDLHDLSSKLDSSDNTFMEESIESEVHRITLDFTMDMPVFPRSMSLIHRGWRNKSLTANLHLTEMLSAFSLLTLSIPIIKHGWSLQWSSHPSSKLDFQSMSIIPDAEIMT